MDAIVKYLEKFILPFAIKIGQQPHINAIKNGFIRIMPLSLIGALFVLINNVFLNFGEYSFFYSLGVRLDPATVASLDYWKGIGGAAYNGTLGIMSLMSPFVIAMAMAEERKVDGMAAGVIGIATFIALTPSSIPINYGDVAGLTDAIKASLPQNAGGIGSNWIGGANIISGMIIGLLVGEIFAFITKKKWVITLPSTVPSAVSKSFSALIPGAIILTLAGFLNLQLTDHGLSFHNLIIDMIAKPLSNVGSVVGWVYIFFSSFLWFFGIHGSLALAGIDSGVMGPFALENVELYVQYGSVEAAIAAGKEFHMWAKPMVDSYIYLGGTGATLGLILAIFMASKRDDYRAVAKLATPSGIFQINEPILFGLPVIMNPLMFIPYMLVQPALGITTTIAYNIGFIPPITNISPWTMPVGLGAFFNTNGSISAVILAFLNLGLATLIYLPFVIAANKAANIIDKKEETEEDIAAALKF